MDNAGKYLVKHIVFITFKPAAASPQTQAVKLNEYASEMSYLLCNDFDSDMISGNTRPSLSHASKTSSKTSKKDQRLRKKAGDLTFQSHFQFCSLL